ncbi:MAG: hypothetical protein M3Z22_05365, partial [Verrucomicrobiota bacterium]|nr:hypothetical protein [Verrucomicrobiota bacterium]
MTKERDSAAPTRSNAVLRIASSPLESWNEILLPWFAEAANLAWKQALPSLVVVPSRGYTQALRTRLLAHGESHLGLQFIAPAGLRRLFTRTTVRELPRREDLRLLLAISAEEVLHACLACASTDESEAEIQAAKAVLRAPDHLLRTIDRLTMAGWDFARVQLPAFEPIVRRFQNHLDHSNTDLPAEYDRRALRHASAAPPLFGRVLISGFDGAHWPDWFLLRAAVAAAEHATVVLQYPAEDFADADQCWISSWEEVLRQEAAPVSFLEPRAGDSFFTEAEMRGLDSPAPDCAFLVGAHQSEEAQAVALQCVRFLAQESCTRIAVIFACAGALPRLVSHELCRLEIAHHDAIGHPLPSLFESAGWQAWLELQQGQRIGSLLRLANALDDPPQILCGLDATAFERALRAAHSEILIDDLEILQRFFSEQPSGSSRAAGEALQALHFLPSQGVFQVFLRETEAALEHLGWRQHWMEISRHLGTVADTIDLEFSRALFLRWLREITFTFSTERAPRGDHPYARVQLLTVAEAQAQDWSHLIFAGWNEGVWPPAPAGEFMREDEIGSFNREIRRLNSLGKREGRQGEGHTAVQENHSLYVGPAEQRLIARRQFQALRDAATEGLAMSASLVQESAPD